jgi:predicted permease
MFRDLEAAQTGFSGIAAHRLFDVNLSYQKQTLNAEGMLVSGSYFPVLGLRPALGRLLSPADDQTIGGHSVAVLSHSYWESRLGSDPDVIDKTIVVNGQAMTIVGVAPEGFNGTTLGGLPNVFVPISMRAEVSPGIDAFDNRQSYWAYLFARLKPGVGLERAATAVNRVYRPILNDVEAPLQQGISERVLANFRSKEVVLEPGDRGQSSAHGEARMALILLFAITGVVLLIACANIANLLLARGASRGMEMAVRLSLGATRRQVLSQLLTESLVLAVLGGIASLLVAKWTLAVISSILPPEGNAALQLGVSPRVVVFAGGLAIGTGLIFGMFPALHSTRPDLMTTIRANTGQIAGARAAAHFRTTLVTAQIALSMMLLISAGLFVKSLLNISRVDLGVRVENVVTFGISPELNGYTPVRAKILFDRVEEELAALPGVSAVTASMVPILAGGGFGTGVAVEGFERGPEIDSNSLLNRIGAGYFHTLGVPMVAGREFTTGDALKTQKVAIVNEAFARKFNLGRDAVGKWIGVDGGDDLDVQIVGLVQDAKYNHVKEPVPPLFFTPYRQDESLGTMTFYVRTVSDPRQILRSVPGVISGLDPNLPVENLKTLQQQVREIVFADRLISTLSAAFALLATLLAAVGLYGVLAYTVAQRTREIGVRMALGADAARVRGLVLGQVGKMMLVGGVIGVLAGLGVGTAAGSMLFGLQGNDPLVVIAAAGVLAIVAFGAGYIPALRASRIDPMRALRYD